MNYRGEPADVESDADETADVVDVAVAKWRIERPDLDVAAMGPMARLARLGVLGGKLVDQVFADAGLDRGEFNVLAALRRSGAPYRLTPSQLAEAELTTRGGMTKRIDRLEARGLVERLAHGADRRSLLVALTADGVTLADEVVARHSRNQSRLLAGLTEAEVETLDGLLRVLLVAVGDAGSTLGHGAGAGPTRDDRVG